MELRQLEYFVAVAEEASFTRAAVRTHVAQPGVSAQVRRLERELGLELLDRSGRSVATTAAGAAVLPFARAALAAAAGARHAVEELTGLMTGHVAVGMVTACESVDLTDLLAAFHDAHPAIEMRLVEGHSDRLIDDLLGGRLDLAWVGLAGPPPEGIETQVIADERLVAAVAHDDPLAERSTITLTRLRECGFISMPPGTGLRTALDGACATLGFEPTIALEASAMPVLAQLAARGLGVAILPQSVAAACSDTLHAVAIRRPALRARVALAWRAGGPASPAARALVAHARQALAAA
jgi:DNA-binding transcriptional LysR family regulator